MPRRTQPSAVSRRSASRTADQSVSNIQHHDSRALVFGDDPSLLQDFFIVPPQTVDALDHKGIALLQSADELSVIRALKILAGLLVREDPLPVQSELLQRHDLPLLALLLRGYSRVTVFYKISLIQSFEMNPL